VRSLRQLKALHLLELDCRSLEGRATRNTPAATICAALDQGAEIGVGPSMASGNQT